MGRNNICVIYDSDENYAKRLMSVINDDNDIPYNAQVFTKEHELDKYLQEKEADMLMICEGAYGYNAYRRELRLLCCVRRSVKQMRLIQGKKKDWLEYVSISRHISFYSL